jgi:RimJ/RimL family protein N-acetyltransferase
MQDGACLLRDHGITLAGERVVLRPMTENDWDILVQWNNDPEVLQWTEGTPVSGYDIETVQAIYRGKDPLSQFNFIIEFDGKPVGECWLQHMNLPRLLTRFPNCDHRRIDIMIGEKELWGQGIGTEAIRLLTRFGFEQEKAEAIFGICFEINERSRRAFIKNGYTLYDILSEPGEKDSHALMLTKASWCSREE